jgi:NADH-quinone oxidoreductase subunit N
MGPTPPVVDSLLLAALLAFMGVVLMVASAIYRPMPRPAFWGLSLATVGGALCLLAVGAGQPATEAFSGMLRIDAYGTFFSTVILLGGLFSLLISDAYMDRIGVRVGEFYPLALFALCGMLGMACSNDLIMTFISLEIMSIAVYVLCAIKRSDERAVESGFKYFILGAFSSAVLLYGVAFIFGATGSTSLTALNHALRAAGGEATPMLALGGALLLVGFGFKVASVPFHMWAPDVYQGAPTAVTALMASGVKAASFAAFGRVVIGAMGDDAVNWAGALWWMSAATMLVGNVAALVQRDLKRMFAYSSVAHAGYLLMALSSVASGGAVGNEAIGSLAFYMLAYTLMNAGAFAVLALMTDGAGDDATDLSRLAGLGRSHPALAAGLSVCLVSLAGLPPTMGFIGKFYLFTAAIGAGEVGLAFVGAIGAAAGIYYYLRPMVYMYMHDGHPELTSDGRARMALCLTSALLIVFGLMPTAILEWANASVASVLG